MVNIQRFHSNQRLSEMAIYNGVIYLAGQVPETTLHETAYEQTKEVLGLVDALLKEAGSNKSRIINVQIYLSDMDYYDEMNQAWDEWVDTQAPPTRATVETKLAVDNWKVEIVVTAAV